MKELKELSINYATEKTNEVMINTIAQAFADGYRMGYKDREDEIPVDLRDGNTEYVDLGLPSGTLWSNDYEKTNNGISYIPYLAAKAFNLPSEEQWKELNDNCRWEYELNNGVYKFICIGPNGNSISFYNKGMYTSDGHFNNASIAYFWFSDDSDSLEKSASYLYYGNQINLLSQKQFMGYKLPIRLIKRKIS